MDETIGVKGGKRDRKRSLIISQNKKKKIIEDREDKELRELEKKVKKQQIYTLIKTLPIVIGGGTVKTLYDVGSGKSNTDLEDENSKWRIKEYDADISSKTQNDFEREKRKKIITTPDGDKVVVYVSDDLVDEKNNSQNPQDVEHNGRNTKADGDKPVGKVSDNVAHVSGNNKTRSDNVSGSLEDRNDNLLSNNDYVVDDLNYVDGDFSDLPSDVQSKIQQLKSRKIVDEYEKQLKDIRYDLRRVIYEYNVLVDENDKVVLSKEAEVLLDKLSDIISRIEALKSKLRVEDIDKYDDNYIYFLIEEYLKEFKKGKLVDEIKDSPLYVMISSKIDELENKRDDLDKKVTDKKERLEEKEKSFENMKKRYYSVDRLNKELLDFQNSQDRMLKEIREKVDSALTEKEKIEYEFVGMNMMSRRMLRTMNFLMFLPGPKYARGVAATTAAHLYFLNSILRPRTRARKYRVITVKDYSSEILSSIDSINDAINMLDRTSSQIDKMIVEINDKFRDYFGVIPECDEMIRNLRRIQDEVEEKEYEMERLKRQQEYELEKNNAKVKKIGEYPVN